MQTNKANLIYFIIEICFERRSNKNLAEENLFSTLGFL